MARAMWKGVIRLGDERVLRAPPRLLAPDDVDRLVPRDTHEERLQRPAFRVERPRASPERQERVLGDLLRIAPVDNVAAVPTMDTPPPPAPPRG